MNKEDKQRVIGKVVAINSDRFTIELLSGIDNFNVNDYDDIHYFAQLNSYVILPYQNYYIVAEVAGIREKDLNVPFSNPTEQILSKVKAGKYLEVLPIGMLKIKDDSLDFEFGVSVYPALYTDTLYIKESELDAIFNVKNQEAAICLKHDICLENCTCNVKRYLTLPIGKSTIFPDYDVKINIDKFFGSHSAVLGNTGSGKSCTISSILQTLFKLKECSATGSTFIVFDVNGEYEQAFSNLNNENNEISLKVFSLDNDKNDEVNKVLNIPHWFFNFEEWALLLQASEKTQQPVLRNALKIAALLQTDDEKKNNLKNHIVAQCCLSILTTSQSSVVTGHRIQSLLKTYAEAENLKNALETYHFNFRYGNFDGNNQELFTTLLKSFLQEDFHIPDIEISKFDLSQLHDYLDIAILYEESHGNNQIRDYCSSLLTRAKVISERSDFSFLNGEEIEIETFNEDVLGLIRSGENVNKETQVILFNLHSVEDEIVEIITCVLSRMIYEALKKMESRNTYPVNLILEEAHRYIGDDPKREFLKANRIFERIAKEGRKFGVFFMISSQRPSELSKTVLSQCNNFIVHRIQNPEDLSHIRQITPHISDTILKRMPSIPTQNALIFGHAVNLPTMFKVTDANPTPKSENNQISKNWFRPKNFTVYKVVKPVIEVVSPDIEEAPPIKKTQQPIAENDDEMYSDLPF